MIGSALHVPGRVMIGVWHTRSGNAVAVYLEPDPGDGVRQLTLAWDSPPPLSVGDLIDYYGRILPEMTERVAEYLEVPCRRSLVLV